MPFSLHEIPLFRIVLGIIIGIVLYMKFPMQYRLSSFLFYALALLIFIGIKTLFQKNIKVYFFGLSFAIVALGFGYALIQEYEIKLKKDHPHITADHHLIEITENLKSNSLQKCFANIIYSGSTPDNLQSVKEKVLVYFRKTETDSCEASLFNFNPGDRFLIKAKVQRVAAPLNPEVFDYSKYLQNKGIYFQLYLNSNQYQFIEHRPGNLLTQLIDSMRTRAEQCFTNYLGQGEERALAFAMILGNRKKLDQDLIKSFSETGAIHVLAVSGLHVGIVGLLLLTILNLIPNKRYWFRIVKGLLCLLGVWGFALLTGAGSAVIRAGLMFTFFYLSRVIYKRQVSIYNLLLGSGLIMVLYQPTVIRQIGFQFSYLAVWSIVFFYPRIFALIPIKNKILSKIWSGVAVAIASQFLVFPLSIYYFGMFANSFILSNLFAVYAAMISIGLGALLLVLEAIQLEFINHYLIAPLLSLELETFISWIQKIQALPMSSSKNLTLSILDLFLLYLSIFFTMGFMKTHQAKALIIGQLFMLAFFAHQYYQVTEKKNQKIAFIYHAKKGSCLDVFAGTHCFEYSNSIDPLQAGFIYERNRTKHRIDKIDSLVAISSHREIEYLDGTLRLGNKILVVENHLRFRAKELQADSIYLLVNAQTENLEELNSGLLKKAVLILDGSLDWKKRKQLIAMSKEKKYKYWDIKKQGAKEISW